MKWNEVGLSTIKLLVFLDSTCGLQTLPDPPSDDLTPQKTTNQDLSDREREAASLSCPGSSVVTEHERPDK